MIEFIGEEETMIRIMDLERKVENILEDIEHLYDNLKYLYEVNNEEIT